MNEGLSGDQLFLVILDRLSGIDAKLDTKANSGDLMLLSSKMDGKVSRGEVLGWLSLLGVVLGALGAFLVL